MFRCAQIIVSIYWVPTVWQPRYSVLTGIMEAQASDPHLTEKGTDTCMGERISSRSKAKDMSEPEYKLT